VAHVFWQLLVDLLRDLEQPLRQFTVDELLSVVLNGLKHELMRNIKTEFSFTFIKIPLKWSMFVAFVRQNLDYCLAISLPNITDQFNNENFEKTRFVPARLHFLHEFF
jgi:hypothetical protein